MKNEVCCDKSPPLPRRSSLKRRIRLAVRLLVRRLIRIELVKTDSGGNPKINPIRWIV
jgi:hypothetical protein